MEIRKLIKLAESVYKRCGDDTKAELKEKTKFLSQIFKDVSEHLSKTVYTMSIEEFKTKEPEKIFRNFVNIEVPILEFKKKLEEREIQLKLDSEKKRSLGKKPEMEKEITT